MPSRSDPYAARVRAARAYADLDRVKLGNKIGFSKETISRIEGGSRPVSEDPAVLGKIAKACGVPLSFLERGFEIDRSADLDERMRAAEQRIAQLESAAGARLTDGVLEIGPQDAQSAPAGRRAGGPSGQVGGATQ